MNEARELLIEIGTEWLAALDRTGVHPMEEKAA